MMIKILFSAKSTDLHENKINCKRNEIIKKTKIVSQVKFDKSLNLIHVHSH